MVSAKIYKTQEGRVRLFVQRERRKWWRELGQHPATDKEFERALMAGEVRFLPKIYDEAKLFQ